MDRIADPKISSGYTYVDTDEGVARLAGQLRGTDRVAIDTEADSLHHYFEKVCLIQLSFLGTNYIVDPLAGISLDVFFKALAPKKLIFQGADYDLRFLKKSFGFRPQAPIFDTMLAAQVLGYEKIGLAALAERFIGVTMSKSGQKADWAQRPLPVKRLVYASDDTKYLETIADAMTERLQKLNRLDWHRECCERVVEASGMPDRNEGRETWRVKGSYRLVSAELVYVKELWKWRDEEARKRDRPVFYILKNEDLIELAVWRARNLQSPLPEGPAFLKRFSGESFKRLQEAVRSADVTPPMEWPLPEKRTDWRDERPDLEKLEPLLAACKALARDLQIEPSFLAPRAALTAVIQHQPRTVEKIMEVSGLMKWQATLLLPAIQALPVYPSPAS